MTTKLLRLLPLLLPALLSACAGSLARSHTLLPAMREAWPEIRMQVESEAAAAGEGLAAPAIAAADAALQADDPLQFAAVDWPLLDMLAEGDVVRRLAAGSIAPGVAASLRERLARFLEARRTYLRQR